MSAAGSGDDVRPWGKWEILAETPLYKVKRIHVLAGRRLSYQTHARRQEHWFVVQGRGLATLEGRDIPLSPGQALDIPRQSPHRVAASTAQDLVFIEVQTGDYFGEDDIVRLQDDYGRTP